MEYRTVFKGETRYNSDLPEKRYFFIRLMIKPKRYYSKIPYIQYCFLFIFNLNNLLSNIQSIFARLTITNCIKSKVLDYKIIIELIQRPRGLSLLFFFKILP